MAATSFPGRVIIDHMPKTGGQALTTWLVGRLGTGCVSPDLMGGHRELIETYAGHYAIISGHMHFFEGEALDPRYQYITCLREPVDRVLSWLFYILNDSAVNERSTPIKEVAKAFLQSEGKECPSDLVYGYSNYYVYHFSSVLPRAPASKKIETAPPADNFKAALSTLAQFDVVGIFEDFPGFTAEVAGLIGVDEPKKVRKVNVSTPRPAIETISKALLDRIVELNQDDIRLYSEVVAWKKQRALTAPAPKPKPLFGWLGGVRKAAEVPSSPAVTGPASQVDWAKYEPTETLLTAAFGSLSVVEPVPRMIPGQRRHFRVTITNNSFQTWRSSARFPLKTGYQWIRPNGESHKYEDLRTPLPAEPLSPGASVTIDMDVAAPREPGIYTLVLTVLQEFYCRLEQRGFTPAIVQVAVARPAPPKPPQP